MNSNGLHQLLADAIFEIIDRKSVVFPKATSSKTDYLDIPPWRRATIFVFLARFLCNKKGQQRWRAYSLSDYKFNVRCFRRYMAKDADILRLGRQFLRLSPQRQNKKRNRITVATSDSTPDMARLRFAVKDNSSTEEEAVLAAALPARHLQLPVPLPPRRLQLPFPLPPRRLLVCFPTIARAKTTMKAIILILTMMANKRCRQMIHFLLLIVGVGIFQKLDILCSIIIKQTSYFNALNVVLKPRILTSYFVPRILTSYFVPRI